jgi:PAS domain S-box-containing protein
MQQNRENLQNLFDALDDFLFILDADGRILNINPVVEKRLGYSPEELKGKNVLVVHPPEWLEEVKKILADIAAGKISTCPVPLMAKDGTLIPVETKITRGMWSDQQVLFGISRDITERRQAEQELKKQKAYFEQLFENSLDGILLEDDEGRTLAANKSFETLFGYSLKEIQDHSANDFIIPTHLLDEALDLTDHALQGNVVQEESVRKRKDGSLVDVEVLGYPISLDNKIVGAYVIYRDISARKQAEKAQRESEDRYRILVQSSGTGVCVIQDDRFRFVNNHLCEIAGFSEEELLEKTFLDLIHPDDHKFLLEQAARRLSGADPLEHDHYRGIRKDGAIIWVELWAALIDFEGQPALLANIIDITERKVAEQSLHESEEKYRLNFENIGDVIYSVDLEFRVTDISPSVETLLGYKPEEVVGRTFNELKLLAPEYHEAAFANAQRLVAGKKNPPTEYEFIAKDGTRKIGEVISSPLMREDEIVGVLSVARHITDRRRTEQALQESEERYRTLVDNALTGIYVRGKEGIVYANKRLIEMLGYSMEELQSMNFLDIIHPDDQEMALKRTTDHIMGKTTPGRREYRAVTKGGEIIHTEVSGTPITYQGEQVILAHVHDITDRKRALQALEDSENRYRTVVDNALTGIYIRSEDGIEFANSRLLEMVGYSMDELRKMTFLELIHPEDRDRARERAAQRMAGMGRTGDSEFRVIVRSGEIIWVDVLGRRIEYEGKPAVLTHIYDITERKKIREELRKREEQYRLLFETVGDVVYIMDKEFRMLSISPSIEAFLGYTPEEMVGRRLGDMETIAPEYYQKAFENTAKILAGESVAPSEYEFIAKDGTRKLAEIRGAPIYEGGKAVAIIAVSRDITQHRRLEQQLFQAQKMESIGTLAGGIAHDFNNILGGILGYASLMKTKTTENHPFYNYINVIEKGAIRASELTAQLLAFARGGKYDIKPIDLNKVVGETLRIIGETFDKSIAIETRLLEDLPTVEADEGQMQQALMNLCINAADEMQQGGTLSLETSIEDSLDDPARMELEMARGPWVVVSVADTGNGMNKETVQRIFEPFYTTKEPGKGTGLGLSMVYGVVKNHGGHVNVYSEPGEGSTFKIYLPVSGKPEEEETKTIEILHGGKELLLVVDDEEHIRSLAKEILEDFGYRVLLAEDGEEAIDIYGNRHEEIALVILDMIMPKMGGRETFARLKELDPDVKAVLSTGYSRDGKAQEMLDDGMMGYIQKPYQVDALLSKVRGILDAAK